MSLRWRIALGLGLITALVCALAAVGAYVSTSRQLQQSIDDSLLARSESANRPDRGDTPGPDRDGDAPGHGCPPPGEVQPAAAAQLVAADGTVTKCIDGSVALPVSAADSILARDGGPAALHTVTVKGDSYRVLTVPWRGGGAFQTARALGESDSVLDSLKLRLALLTLAGIAGAALLGWLFARRLVRPIERLRDAAEGIARTQDLDAPVPRTGGGEIGSLATSFSAMVDALAASRDQQQQLITDASHELRTPLTSLRTNAELLDRGDELDAEQRQSVAQGIQLEVGELTDLVSELVELATDRSSDEAPQAIRLGDVADEVADRARRRTGRPIEIIDDASRPVLVRPSQAERIVSNLVDNAVKYSAGPIEIVIADRRLEVLDHGPGIATADQPHVFDRFFRAVAARTEPGSGLGLAIVQQMVERHGGTVWATNRADGAGACVGFELPGASADDAVSPAGSRARM